VPLRASTTTAPMLAARTAPAPTAPQGKVGTPESDRSRTRWRAYEAEHFPDVASEQRHGVDDARHGRTVGQGVVDERREVTVPPDGGGS
jgi:hypothetical protein